MSYAQGKTGGDGQGAVEAAQQELQRKIAVLAQTEAPYDVFLCCKERGEMGGRTGESTAH